jgi:hypothetical protein
MLDDIWTLVGRLNGGATDRNGYRFDLPEKSRTQFISAGSRLAGALCSERSIGSKRRREGSLNSAPRMQWPR